MKNSIYYQSNKAAFPSDDNNEHGMTYREWLIGQALATVSDSYVIKIMNETVDESKLTEEETSDMFTTLIAGLTIRIADKIIEQLANE